MTGHSNKAVGAEKAGSEDGLQPYLTLGLDLGISSVGFALIDLANHEILEMGARLFDAPQNPKNRASLAAERREHRSVRRNTKRDRNRRKQIFKLLVDEGIVPADETVDWLKTRKGDVNVLDLRKEGLDRLLNNREWAQVLFVLSKHRGYIPHGEGNDDTDGKKVLKSIEKNETAVKQGGYRTVGEYLAETGSSRNEKDSYKHSVKNEQIVQETRTLFESQRRYGSEHAGSAFEERYLSAMTWQKNNDGYDERVYDRVGWCTYFPEDERRAAKADLSSEMCSAWERLGHITVIEEDLSAHPLPFETRRRAVEVLFSPNPMKGNMHCRVTYAMLRKSLDLSGNARFKGIAYENEKDDVYRPRAWQRLRTELSQSRPELLQKLRWNIELTDQVCEALTFASSKESLKRRLADLDLANEEVDAILSLPYNSKAFKGYGTRSRKALDMLLSAFQDPAVTTLFDAEAACGPDLPRPKGGSAGLDELPPYEGFDKTCTNPVVLRAMSQTRKVVNAIIREHGIPNEVHIEVARELKMSKKQKENREKKQRANEAERKRARVDIAQLLGCEPDDVTNKQVLKYQLYAEQGGKDVYTDGKGKLVLERVMLDDNYADIDHILPYSRTADDRRSNKVLVAATSNRSKGTRTPYEWMSSGEADAPDWATFKALVTASKAFTPGKRAHLLNTGLAEGFDAAFINRNLNDTRYMSRSCRAYVEENLAFPEDDKQHVFVNAGGATAALRWAWGLNFGSGNDKDRSDDRHHAVDACVIACCTMAHVRAVALASAHMKAVSKEERKHVFADTQPWGGFADLVRHARHRVVPTRMSDHKATGAAFEETAYKLIESGGRHDLLAAKEAISPAGNARVLSDGNARKLGGAAWLDMWFDSDARKGKGRWLFEPVYYADLPDIRAGRYVHRVFTREKKRSEWDVLPEEDSKSFRHIRLFKNDVLFVNGSIGRYTKFGMASCQLSFESVFPEGNRTVPSKPSGWGADDVFVLNEDPLGHCYRPFFQSSL